MSRRHVPCVATIASVCLLASLLVGALPARAALVDPVVVRVPAKAWAQLPAAKVKPGQTLDYGSYRWVEMERADLAKLEASGIAYELVTEARQVRVPGYAFDPLVDGEPTIAPAMRADAARPGFQLVQMQGPPKDEWLAALNGGGARTLQYYPHNTYLVWATPAASEAVAQLGFVRWTGAFHPAYKVNGDLRGRSGTIRNVDVMFYSDDVKGTVAKLGALGAEVLQFHPSQPDGAFYDAIVVLEAGKVDAVAALPEVLWLGYESPRPGLDDEMSDQIVAGNHPGGTPVTGYNAHLGTLGVDGTGVTWAVIDTGVDWDHQDLSGHLVGGYTFPGVPAGCVAPAGNDCSAGGHGTHVAGIIGGDATAGFTDAGGFFYGLGMAPEYSIFAMNSLVGPAWPPAGGWQEHSKRALLGGAVGGNNSWHTGEGANHGYQASERTHDLMVRDGNFDTAVHEPFIEVFSAGNEGPSPSTITPPHEAKNLIAVANSLNARAGSIDAIASGSSRGPAVDGRVVPTVAAPGSTIASTRNDTGGSCSTAIGGTSNQYAFCSGTSMAAPHVSGAAALIVDWWRDGHAGANPSPALVKALLVNTAVDMGAADIPNFNEGWGRINVTNVITPPTPAQHWEQDAARTFGTTGEDFQVTLGVVNPGQPVKVTLVWTDAAGAVGANPALVNNLDLTVVDGANTYLGNRFVSGWSATGGSTDTRNNVENVYIQLPSTGTIDVTVAATAINGDGIPGNGDLTDQDFALVCTNCALTPDFTLGTTPASVSVCAPTDAQYTINVGNILSFTDPVTLSASGNPAGTTVNFTTNPVTPPGSSTLTIGNTGAAAAGAYSVQVDGTSTTGTKSRTVGLDVFAAAPSAVSLLTPADGAISQPLQPAFTWQAVAEGGTYTVEVASDAAFTNIVGSATGVTSTNWTFTGSLNTNTTYYWRVRAVNACGTGADSSVRSFITEAAPGDCAIGTTLVPLYGTDFETGPSQAGWTHSAGVGADSWAISNARAHSGVSSFRATAPGSVADQYLVSPAVALPAGVVSAAIKLWDYQHIEDQSATLCYDGAVLEISTNGGSSWTRIEAQLVASPYKGPVNGGFDNPIAGSNAWCGEPRDWTQIVANVTAFAGQVASFRFRLATDESFATEGWYVDDVSVHACIALIFKDGFEPGNFSLWTGGTSP